MPIMRELSRRIQLVTVKREAWGIRRKSSQNVLEHISRTDPISLVEKWHVRLAINLRAIEFKHSSNTCV